MASSRLGFGLLVDRVSKTLGVSKKAASETIGKVLFCLEGTIADNIESDGFAIKLNKFGKLTIRHRPAGLRKIPLTGETKYTGRRRKVRFVTLGRLRKMEKVEGEPDSTYTVAMDPGEGDRTELYTIQNNPTEGPNL